MIPFLLAAVGGYLIGQSRKDQQFADGGELSKESKWFDRLRTYEREHLSKKYPDDNFKSVDEWVKFVYEKEKKKKSSSEKMAQGGVLEHGLRKGDTVVSEMGSYAGVLNDETGEAALINIETGERIVQ